MAGYADELSLKLTARDEMSAKLKTVKAELKSVEQQMVAARKQYNDTGAPEAAREYERLSKEFERLAVSQRELTASGRKLRGELDQIRGSAGRTSSALSRVSTAVKKHATDIRNAGLVMAAALAYFSRGALQRFSQVEDASSALSATFGTVGNDMIAWAKKSGDALNLSQGEALDALLSYAGYARSAKLQGQEIATFSENLVARSADLASYYGGTTADALQALGAALRGEAEPARRYQVFVDDMALKQEALALGIYKGTGSLTAQQKVLAAQQLIMKQTSVAAGDMERTQASMANTLKDTSQQWDDTQSSMGAVVAEGAGPLLRIVNKVLGVMQALPAPLKAVGLGFAATGAAAMIATPRIIAMNTALVSRGGILGVAKASKGAVLGIAAVTAAYVALNSAKDQNGNVFSEENIYATEKFGLALRDIVQPGVGGSIVNVIGGITDALVPHNTYLEDAYTWMGEYDKKLSDLVASGHAEAAVRGFDNLVTSASEWGGTADDITKLLPGYSAALEAAGTATETVATKTDRLSAAQARAKTTTKALDKALDKLDATLARRAAVKDYNAALDAFKKKPSAETGAALDSAASAAAKLFKDPKRQAQFVTGAVEEIRTAVNNTSLSSGIKAQIKSPLKESYDQALKLLGTLRAVARLEQQAAANARVPHSAKFATGGAVFGPGTSTSDSIPAYLSTGEYVIRAAAARTIGYGTLDRLNHADRVPSLPPAVHAPQIVLPAGASDGRPAPLIGSQINHINGQVDMDLTMARAGRDQQRRAESDSRTRFAGTR